MLNTAHEIIEYLKDYILQKGGNNSIWYVGTCQGQHDFTLYAVKISSQFWLYIETGSPQITREVLENCVNTVGLNRDASSTDQTENDRIVYIYKKADR
jgi:hypothetical protein